MGDLLGLPSSCFCHAPVRASDLRYIIDALRRGYDCAIVGPSNTGKSILLQSLVVEEVRQMCAQKGQPAPVMVFVDCLAVQPEEQDFYETLLRRVLEELEAGQESPVAIEVVRAEHDHVARGHRIETRAAFEGALRILRRRTEVRLVVILDEFDELYSELPQWASRRLVALHDELKGRLLFVASTSRAMERLHEDWDTFEFGEMFDQHTRVLKPLDRDDSTRLVEYLVAAKDLVLSSSQVEQAILASGGHPGLLARLAESISNLGLDQALPVRMLDLPAIRKECQRLWTELEADEQAALLVLVRGDQLTEGSKRPEGLDAKGLVLAAEGGKPCVFSPVFEAFVRQELLRQRQTRRRGPWYEPETRQWWLDDEEITFALTPDQRALLGLMVQHPKATVSRDEIAQAVWPDSVLSGISEDQIYQLIKRTRDKIEADPKHPKYLVTVTGEGYRLDLPEQ